MTLFAILVSYMQHRQRITGTMRLDVTYRKCIFYSLLFVLLWILYYSFDNSLSEKTTLAIQKQKEISMTAKHITADIHFDYKDEMSNLNMIHVEANSSKLIGLIRNHFIENPSHLPYRLDHQEIRDPSQGQTAFVDKALNHMEGGFFVECGAHAGEEYSNSLFLERYRNWTGVLIEANPSVYNELKKKNRRAFTLNACLNEKPYPSVVTFLEDSWWGSVSDSNYSKSYRGQSGKGRYVQVQCFPLYSILLALNQTRVDYFSLDVEGAEEGVLDSLPWDKLDIRMMSIEYYNWQGGKSALKAYIEKRGYKYLAEINTSSAADIVVLKE